MYRNILLATEQNKHGFRCSEKPGCNGWCCSAAWSLVDDGKSAGAGGAVRSRGYGADEERGVWLCEPCER